MQMKLGGDSRRDEYSSNDQLVHAVHDSIAWLPLEQVRLWKFVLVNAAT